jgi:hypothetical protein
MMMLELWSARQLDISETGVYSFTNKRLKKTYKDFAAHFGFESRGRQQFSHPTSGQTDFLGDDSLSPRQM